MKSSVAMGELAAGLVLEAAEAEGVFEEEDEPEDRGGEEEGVDAVEDASVAGEHGA